MKTFSIDNTLFAAFAVALIAACGVAHAEPVTVQVPVVIQSASSTISRAEVKADLSVWVAAGMDKYSRDEGYDEVYSAAYKHDYATYAALRSSPQFAVIVADFERGQTPKVVVSRNPLGVSVATR